MNRVQLASKLLHATALAIQIKSKLEAPARYKAICSQIHLKQTHEVEHNLTSALHPFFKKQANDAASMLEKIDQFSEPISSKELASKIFDPKEWHDELVNRALPVLATSMVKASYAQLAAMGVNVKKLKKAIKNCGTGAGGFKPGNTCSRTGGGGSFVAKIGKDGRGVSEDGEDGLTSYAGVHEHDWQDWVHHSDEINDALRGVLKPGGVSSMGEDLTAESVQRFANVGEKIQKAAESNKVKQTVLFRGESYNTDAEVLARYKHNDKTPLNGLLSTAVYQDDAKAYSHSDASLPIKVMVWIGNPHGIQGVQTSPLGTPSGEVVLPKGAVYRVSSKRKLPDGSWRVDLYSTTDHKLPSVDASSPGKGFHRQSIGVKREKASTATEWLENYSGDPADITQSLEDIVFSTPYGNVTLKIATELPQWMKDKIVKQLDETFRQDYWGKINETTLDQIETVLKNGIQNGQSIAQMASDIAASLGGERALARATNIARTESGNALNSARSAAADGLMEDLSEYNLPMRKVWMSVLGSTTRADHANLDGVPVGPDGTWDLGGYKARWPGDVRLPAGQRCNCQCSILVDFGMGDDEAKRLIGEYADRAAKKEIAVIREKFALIEKLAGPHEFSSTQFNIEDGGYSRSQGSPISLLKELQAKVKTEDLHEKGIEDELHVTLKYGLHTQDPKKVAAVLSDQGPVSLTLGKTSIFHVKKDDDEFDVLKVDVKSDDLHRLNKLLCNNLEHTDTFKEYHPHLTLAYLKYGAGKKYVGDAAVAGYTLNFSEVLFSNKEGVKTEINLTGD